MADYDHLEGHDPVAEEAVDAPPKKADPPVTAPAPVEEPKPAATGS